MKTKHELIRFIQSLVRPRIHSVQVSSKDDQKALIKELDKQTTKGPVTVILVGERLSYRLLENYLLSSSLLFDLIGRIMKFARYFHRWSSQYQL